MHRIFRCISFVWYFCHDVMKFQPHFSYGRNEAVLYVMISVLFFRRRKEVFQKMNPWKKKCLTLAVLCALTGGNTPIVGAAERNFSAEASSSDTAENGMDESSRSLQSERDLGETIVTATRISEPLMKVPANVTVITSKELEKRHVFSLREALAREAGIYISPTADVKDGVTMRGFSGSDILVMYNGQMLNTAFDGGVNWDSIPLSNIDRIEIVRGAASSLYGGHAVAGVINIITKKPDASDSTKMELIHGQIDVLRGSNNTWQRELQVTGGDKNISFRVGYEKRTSDGWVGHAVTTDEDDRSYTPDATGSFHKLSDGNYIVGSRGAKKKKSENTFVDLNYAFDKNRSLDYSYLHASYEYSYHDPITYFRDFAGNPTFSGIVQLPNGNYLTVTPDDFLGYLGRREQDIHKLRYEDTKNDFKAGIGYSNTWKDGYSSAYDATSIDWTGTGDRAEYPTKNYNADLQKQWMIGNNTVLAGFSWIKDKMRYRRYDLLHWKDWDSVNGVPYQQSGGSVMSSALFVQDELALDARWKLQLGMRYDRFDKQDGYSYIGTVRKSYEDTVFHAWSPKIAVSYEPQKDTMIYLSYGKSFNPPSIYKLYRRAGDRPRSIQANPDLTPEISRTFELGMKQKIDKNTSYGLTLFRVDTADKIAIETRNRVRAYYNMNKSMIKGVELAVKHRFHRDWQTYFNYTFESGEDTIGGKTYRNWDLPKHMMRFGIEYNRDKFNGTLDTQYVAARQSVDTVTGEYGSEDSFFVTNLYLNYKINENFKLRFGIENLFNRKYYAGETANDRTYTFGTTYSF